MCEKVIGGVLHIALLTNISSNFNYTHMCKMG
jgi:hypothetical protein